MDLQRRPRNTCLYNEWTSGKEYVFSGVVNVERRDIIDVNIPEIHKVYHV